MVAKHMHHDRKHDKYGSGHDKDYIDDYGTNKLGFAGHHTEVEIAPKGNQYLGKGGWKDLKKRAPHMDYDRY